VDTGRLEAFSDGVFAIAITLLILNVDLPGGSASLAHRIGQAWPSYLAFVISFVTIGIMWANHHSIFHLIDRTTHGLIVANLLLLLSVSFVPFPTRLLSGYLAAGGPDERTAALLYGGTFVTIAVFYNVVWQTAARNNRLIVRGGEAEAAQVTRRFRFGVPGYLVATLLTLASVPAGLAVEGGLALLYLLPHRNPSPGGPSPEGTVRASP
jgi:uncharacterized membrane protein